MRIPNEIVHEDENTIEFTMFDDVMNETARKLVDRSKFISLEPDDRVPIRQQINHELNRLLDRESVRREQKVTNE